VAVAVFVKIFMQFKTAALTDDFHFGSMKA